MLQMMTRRGNGLLVKVSRFIFYKVIHNMEKKSIAYGHWYPVREGGMPEDLLGYKTYDKFDITEAVLIPHSWGNEHGGGEYYPVCRIRRKGTKRWEWYNVKTAKPLFWMAIPKIPTKAGVVVYEKHFKEVYG